MITLTVVLPFLLFVAGLVIFSLIRNRHRKKQKQDAENLILLDILQARNENPQVTPADMQELRPERTQSESNILIYI